MNEHTYKYYSTQRPVSVGTYPSNNNVINITNYDERTYIQSINREAWGELTYSQPLTEKQLSDYELVMDPSNYFIDNTENREVTHGEDIEKISQAIYNFYEQSDEAGEFDIEEIKENFLNDSASADAYISDLMDYRESFRGELSPNELIQLYGIVSDLSRITGKENKFSMPIAIESTDDYSDYNFRANMRNEEGRKKEDYYRIVFVNDSGMIQPLTKDIFDIEENAKQQAENMRGFHTVSYDDIVDYADNMKNDETIRKIREKDESEFSRLHDAMKTEGWEHRLSYGQQTFWYHVDQDTGEVIERDFENYHDVQEYLKNLYTNDVIQGSSEITLHIKYAEPKILNGFVIEDDTITFDNIESVEAYANGEVVYDILDNSVQKKDNEILLYAENEQGEVVWGEKKEREKTIDYIVLQKERERYVFSYDKNNERYSVTTEQLLGVGSQMSMETLSVEKAQEKITDLKSKDFFEFRNAREISWYATVENNTPYEEKWEVKNGTFIPIESHSVGIATIDGHSCRIVDEWQGVTKDYVLGQDIEDNTFYYVRVTDSEMENVYNYEYDRKPSHEDVVERHLNHISKIAIDRHEAEYGADGSQNFPHLNDVSPEEEQAFQKENETELTIDDFELLEIISDNLHSDYRRIDVGCKIKGKEDVLCCFQEGESFYIHSTSENKQYNEELSNKLGERIIGYERYKNYENKIAQAKTKNELNEIESQLHEHVSYAISDYEKISNFSKESAETITETIRMRNEEFAQEKANEERFNKHYNAMPWAFNKENRELKADIVAMAEEISMYEKKADIPQESRVIGKYGGIKLTTSEKQFYEAYNNALNHREEINNTSPLKGAREEKKNMAENEKQRGIQQTAEEPKTVKDIVMQQLKDGIKQTLDSEHFADWCRKQGKLYYNNYSITNAMLTYFQKPEASYVCGYEAWKNFGRQVKNGAKGIKILAPVFAKEYGAKGSLLSTITKKCNEQFKKDSTLEYATYRLGQSKLSFNMYKNGLFDVKINDEVKMAHITSGDMRKFLDQSVIGKVPTYYNAITVFDISDTTDNVEYLWVNKDACKESEMVFDDNGNPIKNKSGQFKIINSEERKARFNININMTLKEQDTEKMQVLYETLQKISNDKGIPMSEASPKQDNTLAGGALGYYRHPTSEFPNGNIVISSELSLTNKIAVAFHEIAHSDLHRDLEKLKAEMGGDIDKITKNMKEVQAEAVAYMTASTFGIETEHKSFAYIANWSDGRELKSLEQSLNVIYKESRKLLKEIETDLDQKGYTLAIEPKENIGLTGLTAEEKQPILDEYYSFIVENLRENEDMQKATLNDLKDLKMLDGSENEAQAEKTIVKEQYKLTAEIQNKIGSLHQKVDQFEKSTDKQAQTKLEKQMKAEREQVKDLIKKFDDYSTERLEVIKEAMKENKASMKQLYTENPIKAMEKLQESYPQMKDLSKSDLKFIATSGFISRNYSQYLGSNNEKFIELSMKQLENFKDVLSKNKSAVEIAYCEQWSDEPIFKDGTVLHPKQANKIIASAEKQIVAMNKKAKDEDEYYPYSKCRLAVYAYTGKDELSVLTTRVDIGDGTQKDLSDHLSQLYSYDDHSKMNQTLVQVREQYEKSTRERSNIQVRIPYNEQEHGKQVSDVGKEMPKITFQDMNSWRQELQNERNAKSVGESKELSNENEKRETVENEKE